MRLKPCVLLMVGVLSGWAQADLQELSSDSMSDVTGQVGLTFNTDLKVNGGDIAYTNPQVPSQPKTVFHDVRGQMTANGLNVDVATVNISGTNRSVLQMTLPSQVRFNNFGVGDGGVGPTNFTGRGIYLSNTATAGTAAFSTPSAMPSWPAAKTLYISATTYYPCDGTCQGKNSSFRIAVTHGRLESVGFDTTDWTSGNVIKAGEQMWMFAKTEGSRGRDSGWNAGRHTYPWTLACFCSPSGRNNWVKWVLPYGANAQIDYSGTDLGIDKGSWNNDPWLKVYDPDTGTTSNYDDHSVIGFTNENARAQADFGNRLGTWGASAQQTNVAAAGRFLLGVSMNGNFEVGGQMTLRP